MYHCAMELVPKLEPLLVVLFNNVSPYLRPHDIDVLPYHRPLDFSLGSRYVSTRASNHPLCILGRGCPQDYVLVCSTALAGRVATGTIGSTEDMQYPRPRSLEV